MVRLRVVQGEDHDEAPSRHPNAHLLLDADALGWAVLDRGSALLDVRSRNAYRAAHLPTAVHLGHELDPDRPLPPRAVLERSLARAGVTRDRPVVVYDEDATRGAAAFAVLVLEHLGFRDVRLLEGGMASWRGAGRTVEIALRIRLGGGGIRENELVTRSSRLAKRRPHLERARRGEASAPVPPERARFVSAEELARLVGARAVTVIDGRSDERFNGWCLDGEPRGGHVPGALSLPATLLFDEDGTWKDADGLVAALVRAGVPAEAELVTAGGREGAILYFALRLLDHPSARVLDGGMRTWLEAEALPVATIPGWAELVPAEWLIGQVSERTPASNLVIAAVSWGGPEVSYDAGHIPGAIHVDTDAIEADTRLEPRNWWNLVPDATLQDTLEGWGIAHDSTVVVYAEEPMAAARVAWALLYAGVDDVRMLNGGLAAWRRAGGRVELERPAARVRRSFGKTVPARPELRVHTHEVRATLGSGALVLGDVRSAAEYTGEVTGYDYVRGRGRIPGATWLRGGPSTHYLEEYEETGDRRLRALPAIAAMWREAGLDPARRTAFYCGTGWRAALAFFVARWLGFEAPCVYDGGWFEWSSGPEAHANPIEPSAAIEPGAPPPTAPCAP